MIESIGTNARFRLEWLFDFDGKRSWNKDNIIFAGYEHIRKVLIQRGSKNEVMNVSRKNCQYYSYFSVLLYSAFGPYIISTFGLRLEHFIIYPMFVLCTLYIAQGKRFNKSTRCLLAIAAIFSFVTFWILFSSLLSDCHISFWIILAGAENFIQPVALLVIIALILSQNNVCDDSYLRDTSRLICYLLTLNSIVCLLGLFIDTWPLVKYFVVSGVSKIPKTSVWQNSVTMGRYSGIFNQPFENGLAHSIGLLSWVYLVKNHRIIGYRSLILLGLVVTGGLLSVSKVFLFVGIGLGILLWFWHKQIHFLTYFRGFFVCFVFFFLAYAFLNEWQGMTRISRYLNTREVNRIGAVNLYTGGRLGNADTTVKRLFYRAWSLSPLMGFGFGAYSPLDNAFIAYFYQGGIVALFCYFLTLTVLFLTAVHGYYRRKPESKFLFALVFLVFFASFGAPVFTINRASILLWVQIALTATICLSNDANAERGKRA